MKYFKNCNLKHELQALWNERSFIIFILGVIGFILLLVFLGINLSNIFAELSMVKVSDMTLDHLIWFLFVGWLLFGRDMK